MSTPARLKRAVTIFVCGACSGGRDLRRALKAELKRVGRKRDARVVACGCLGLCPKRAASVLVVAAGTNRCAVVGNDADVTPILAELLPDARVADPVAQEQRFGRQLIDEF
jgi:hypothetical protein